MIKRFWEITLKCLSFFHSFHQFLNFNRKIEKGQENDSVLQQTFVGWSRYEGEWKDGIVGGTEESEESEGDTDTTAPILSEVTAVTTPSTDFTPNYTFS